MPHHSAESILAITFTRKACQEIKDRLSVDKLGCKVPVNVFTFHGWAIRFLRMKRIREMAGVPKTLVIWAPRDQKEHMAQACQRARVDHELLPQARRVMGLPVTGQTSPDESWKELLCKAFTDPAIRNSVLCARERAKDRVKAALKEVASPEKDADQEDGELETKDASAEYARQHAGTANAYPVEKTSTSIVQQYGGSCPCGVPEIDALITALLVPNRLTDLLMTSGSLSGPAAAPGASTKPSAKLRHIRTTPKVLAAVDGGLSDSDAEEADIGNEHLKSSHRSGCGHWVEILFPDGSIDTWTLVAKELLTVWTMLVMFPEICSRSLLVLDESSPVTLSCRHTAGKSVALRLLFQNKEAAVVLGRLHEIESSIIGNIFCSTKRLPMEPLHTLQNLTLQQ